MFALARLLIRERLRKLSVYYGWAAYLSAGLMLALFGWAGAGAAARYVRQATAVQLESFLMSIWLGWVIAAILTGKDLSWQIRLKRLLAFPVSGFVRLYTLAFFLGFLSLPLLVFLSVVEFCAFLKSGFALTAMFTALIGIGLFVASVRLTASLARGVIHRSGLLTRPLNAAAAIACVLLSAYAGVSIFHPQVGVLLPSHQFGRLLFGEHVLRALIYMGAFTGVIGVFDFAMQHSLTYSGFSGPSAPSGRMSSGSLLLLHPSWPGPIFRVAILGWLRTRSALMLLIWGITYSFFFTYFSKQGDVVYFFLFIWVNLLFHSAFRGNLLGIDRGGIWLYYMFPVRIESTLSAKSLSLSFLQSCMVASPLVAGFLIANPPLTPIEWIRVVSFAVSGILFGEICGFYFSVRYPDPIDRTSQFDGGTTVGALIVPVFQILFLVVFALVSGRASRLLSPALYWCSLLGIPASLCVVRFAVLQTWVHTTMLGQTETIIKKLSAF